VGQQPNIPLSSEDLPLPGAAPAPPRRWRAGRPGDLGSPAEVPWGGAFGTPGPDAGYALRLLAGRPLALAAGERRADAERALAAVMVARASRLGRAPTAIDAEAAELLLGYGEARGDQAAAGRRALVRRGAAVLGELLESISPEVLVAEPGELRESLAGQGRPVG
jgi:hypothetical protein